MTNFKTLSFIKIKAFSLLVAFFFSFFLIGCGGNTSTTNTQVPVITSQPIDSVYAKDDTANLLSVSANVNDGGTLSYQWYSNTVNSNENGVLILNETSSTYTPSTSDEGTAYYYVVVTNTNNNVNGNKIASVTSDTAEIVVNIIKYTINCFDTNLTIENTIDLEGGVINPSDISICGSGNWYLASSNTPVTSHNLNSDINFYTVANIIEITTQTQLDDIRNNLSGKYILLNDIDLNETEAGFDTDEGWNAIGSNTASYRFTGILNGNGYKITNLWINKTTNYQGLFGYIDNAQIKNLGVETAEGKEVKGYDYVGGITGYNNNSAIENSYFIGTVTGYQYIGGITGYNRGVSTIANCNSSANISGRGIIGGITGYNRAGTVKNSYFTGNVGSTSNNVGGIAGFNTYDSVIINSYSTGNVNGSDMVGGIVGGSTGSNISNSYSTGNISGTTYVGGIAGQFVASGGVIINSYSTGNVNGSNAVGGIAGHSSLSSVIINSYSTGAVNGNSNVSGIVGYNVGSDVIGIAAINPSLTGASDINRVIGNYDSGTVSDNFALDNMTINGAVYNGAEDNSNGISKSIEQFTAKETYSNSTTDGGLGWSFGDNDTSPWKWEDGKNNDLPYLYWQEL
jgi:hypothetical protein